MRELQRRNREVFFITSYKTRRFLKERLTRDHIDITRLLAGVPISERRRIKQRVAEIAPELKRVLGNRDGGCDRWLEAGLLAKAVAKQWAEGASAIIVDADFEAVRKGFLLGAAEAGVPSLMLQHGTWGPMMFPIHATITGCWGELSRRETNDYGLEPERSVALGSPRWDCLINQRNSLSQPEDRIRCGGDPKRPFVLLISNTHVCHRYPELYEPYFEGVARLLEATDVDVAIKQHPSEVGLTEYQKRIPERMLARLRTTPQELGLHRPLLACDVVYHVGSAASLEAMMLGVPTLFEKGREATPAKYAPPLYGGGDWCGPDDVVHRVCELAKPGVARASLLERQTAFLDLALVNRGRSAHAVADYLESMTATRVSAPEALLAR
ncbi:MAG: hypothetical protein N2039_12965 [Gemmataceae bacterium]|nr:hypothetical protein [Gemmataceae bacterium]